MKSYDLAFAVDRTQLADGFPQCVLSKEPEYLPGGANIPTSLFRDPYLSSEQGGQRYQDNTLFNTTINSDDEENL